MRRPPTCLLNGPTLEAWPAALLRARAPAVARALAGARWCLRRKRDGRFLAVAGPGGLQRLQAPGVPAPELAAMATRLRRLDAAGPRGRAAAEPAGTVPVAGLRARLDALGLDAREYAGRTGLVLVAEPWRLELAGFDRWRRPLWLRAPAAAAWRRLQRAAAGDGVVLEAISGWRSHDYQLGIFARKRARGQAVERILEVNAAPGFSEHHGGDALDIGCPGEPPAEERFEATAAFAWLQGHAAGFGFAMSYPRDNPHGIVYEPWHWRWAGGAVQPPWDRGTGAPSPSAMRQR